MTLPERNVLNWLALLVVASFGIGVSLWAYIQILNLPVVDDFIATNTIHHHLEPK